MEPTALQFELGEELGSGATGRVSRAVLTAAWGPLSEGDVVAVKQLHAKAASDPLIREAFEREAQVATTVRAPGLLHGFATGETDGEPWLAFEYLPGRDLREALEQSGPLLEPMLRAVAARLTGALAVLEDNGYLHGDLKPENVRFDADGRAVLIDLGFVRPLTAGPAERERIAGSLAYLSPEEARGEPATSRSEVFSLGILLYELATGEHPFVRDHERGDDAACLAALARARFKQPSLSAPTLSPFLDECLGQMLSADPRRRPTTHELQRRFLEQENGAWWRAQLDLHRAARLSNRIVSETHETPLVGRTEELAALLNAARIALTRTSDKRQAVGGVVELSGSGGSGKSRLVREFATLVRRSEAPPVYLYGRCREFEDQRPCQPVLALVYRYLQLPTGSPAGMRERGILEELLTKDESETIIAALDPAFDGTTASPVPLALSAFLVALARRTPLVLFLDDIAWADEGTLEVLARLTESLPGIALLLVLGLRTDAETRRPKPLARLLERAERLPFHERIECGPLDPAAVRELVDDLFASTVPRIRLAQVLWERSRGNPGLIAELLRGLHERRQVLRGPQGLELLVPPDALPLPASLREEIAAAYKRLGPLERIWLSRLSVAGGRIQPGFLEHAWPRESTSELNETLARLTRAGWLIPVADRYRFRRPALREAVYKTLDPGRRRELHADVARALRPGPGGRLSSADALQRAYHLREAKLYEELLRILRPLLKKLLDRGQPQRVHTLALWGIEALEALSAEGQANSLTMVEFLVAGADAADLLGRREDQRVLLDKLSGLDLDPVKAPSEVGLIYLLHGRYSISIGQYGPARGMLRSAIQCFEEAGSGAKSRLSDALRRLSAIHGHVGELGAARRMARRALAMAPDDCSRAQAELALGVVDLLEDRVEAGLRSADRCLILVRKTRGLQALATRARANGLRARIYRGAGRPRRALVSAQRALHFAERSSDRRLETELRARLGCHLLDIDRVAEAESTLRDALLAAAEIEDRRGEAIASLYLGVLLAEQNDPSAGAELARSSRVARELGLNRVRAVALAIQARRRFWHDPAAALEWSTQAMALVEQNGAELIDRVVITGIHGCILDATDHKKEGAELIRNLRRRMRMENSRIESALLKRRHRMATTRLLEAVLSPEGPVYRRVRLDRS